MSEREGFGADGSSFTSTLSLDSSGKLNGRDWLRISKLFKGFSCFMTSLIVFSMSVNLSRFSDVVEPERHVF